MRVHVDQARCEGHGLCEEAAPQLMHLDDEGTLILDVDELADDQVAAAQAAVRVCPVAALRLA